MGLLAKLTSDTPVSAAKAISTGPGIVPEPLLPPPPPLDPILGDALGHGRQETPRGSIKKAHPEWFEANGNFKPGHKAGERPRIKIADLAPMARELTDGGRTILETLAEVMAGLEPLPVRDVDGETGEIIIRRSKAAPTAADRVQAAKILKNCVFGKDPVFVQVENVSQTEAAFDLTRLTPAEVRAYLDIGRKARGAATVKVIDSVTDVPFKALSGQSQVGQSHLSGPWDVPEAVDATPVDVPTSKVE